MSKKEPYCEDCGHDYRDGDECKCSMVAAEMDPAREPDAIERLISLAKEAAQAIRNANEETEGPMAIPPKISEELDEAAMDLEDVYTFLPYELILAIRTEEPVARFNAKSMREADEEGDPLAIDPDLASRHTIKDMNEFNEEMAARMERSVKHIMEHEGPFEAGQTKGLTIKEVIQRYKPNVIVKCPDAEDCFSCEKDNAAYCVHAHEHRVDVECLFGCGLYDEANGCKPVGDYDEENIP